MTRGIGGDVGHVTSLVTKLSGVKFLSEPLLGRKHFSEKNDLTPKLSIPFRMCFENVQTKVVSVRKTFLYDLK
jgi:hypothetical protein